MAIDMSLAREAILRDRRTGQERAVGVFPHVNGQAEVWSLPCKLPIEFRDKVTGEWVKTMKQIPPRRLHWIADAQCIWNPRLKRYEVRL